MSTFVEWHVKSWGGVWPGMWGEEGQQDLFPKYPGNPSGNAPSEEFSESQWLIFGVPDSSACGF